MKHPIVDPELERQKESDFLEIQKIELDIAELQDEHVVRIRSLLL
jgi:hypothetical protein